MFFAFFVVAGLAAGWACRGTLGGLAQLPLRYGWLIVLALLAKVVIFSSPFAASSLAGQAPILYILVNLLLVAGTILNRSLPGLKLLALGLLLNFAAITANGGYMPVSTSALEAAGLYEEATQLRAQGRLVTVRELTGETRVALLGDLFALPPPLPFRGAVSLGDGLIGAGAFWLVVRGMTRRAPGSRRQGEQP